MLTLLQETRFAVRQLWNRPAFTLLAVLTLAPRGLAESLAKAGHYMEHEGSTRP